MGDALLGRNTLIPWEGSKCFAWNATVVDTLAKSCRTKSAEAAGAATEIAADRKASEYTAILASYCSVPLTFVTLGPVNQDGLEFCQTLRPPACLIVW